MFPRFWRQDNIRPITPRTALAARAIIAREPALHTLPGARFDQLGQRSDIETEFSGYFDGHELLAVAWHGISLAVIGAPSEQVLRDLGVAAAKKRRFASIVGDAPTVRALWPIVQPHVGPARETRLSQPLLEALRAPSVAAPGERPPLAVRRARLADLPAVYPAAVAMFREEVGTDPERSDGGRAYRARVEELIQEGRTYVITDGSGRVVFKADVGAVFDAVAQIHGVWTAPSHRGRGIASRAMVSVVDHITREHAPRVTLYVNSFNVAARRAYGHAGFSPVGELATVLLTH